MKYYAGPVDWNTAQRNCIAEGGDLAKIENAQENAVVDGLIGPDTNAVAWIGANDFNSEGNWEWSDSSAVGSYQPWINNQPDNNGIGQVQFLTHTQNFGRCFFTKIDFFYF